MSNRIYQLHNDNISEEGHWIALIAGVTTAIGIIVGAVLLGVNGYVPVSAFLGVFGTAFVPSIVSGLPMVAYICYYSITRDDLADEARNREITPKMRSIIERDLAARYRGLETEQTQSSFCGKRRTQRTSAG